MSCGGGFSSGTGTAASEVENRFTQFWAEANASLGRLSNLQNGFADYTAGWDITDVPAYQSPGVNSMADPGKVELSDIDSLNLPSGIKTIPTITIYQPQIGLAPENTAIKPDLYYPDQPDDLTATVPTDKPDVSDVNLPSEPDPEFPVVPTLREVIIPTAEELLLPTWTQILPTSNIAAPDYEFTFNEADYSSAVLTELNATVLTMLQGGTGLPDEIWQAIIDKAATQSHESGARAVLEATTDFASRGWSLPGGTLALLIREARQRVQHEDGRLLRDIAIKQADMEVENRRFAVAQGIALETVLIGLHNAFYERLLRASALSIELAVQIMNAKIALYNADLTGYQVAATVHKTLIEAELAKIEIFRSEIEAQKLINDINVTDVQLYVARLEAIQKEIDIFVAQLEGVKAQVEVDKTRMEVFKVEVDAYSSQVDAWGKEWDGYTASINGQLAKTTNFQAEIQAFAADVQAYNAGIDGETAKVNADAVYSGILTENLRADTQRYIAETQAQGAKVDADAKRTQAEAAGYQASASFFSAKANAYGAELNASIEDARAAASISLDSARVVSNEIIAQVQIAERAWEAATRTEAQVAGSAMAAINVSASVSSQGSQDESKRWSYNTDCSV